MGRWLVRLFVGCLENLVGILGAYLIAWQALVVGVEHGMTSCLVLAVLGVLTYLGLIAAHELGHLLAAWVVGFPLLCFTVGLFQIVREGGRLRTRLNTAWFQPAAYVQHDCPDSGLRVSHHVIVLLAGPLVNLLLGAASLLLASRVNPGPPHGAVGWRLVALLWPGDPVTGLLNIAGVVSLGLGLFSLVPKGDSARIRSDGGQLLDLWCARGGAGQGRSSESGRTDGFE